LSAEPARPPKVSPSKERLRFWFRAYGAVAAVEREISARLRARFGASLSRFDLMAHLYAAPEGVTMGALTRRLLVSGGNVTGVVDRLEKEGLVAREVDATDRRIYRVALTASGRALFKDMAEEHEAWVSELLEQVDPAEMARATALLEDLRHRLVPPKD
jgi:DNA-binding MarR family transcriptional regulator